MANIFVKWVPGDALTTLSQTVQYKVHTDSVWITAATVSPTVKNYIINGLSIGTSYDVRIGGLCKYGTTAYTPIVQLSPGVNFKWVIDPAASYCEETSLPPNPTGYLDFTLEQHLRALRILGADSISCGLTASVTYTLTQNGGTTGPVTVNISVAAGSNQGQTASIANQDGVINIQEFSFFPYSCDSKIVRINGQESGAPPEE